MTSISKTILTLAAVLLAMSFTGRGSGFLYGLLKPAAAVLIIVAFLQELMPRQSAQDREDPPATPPSQDRGR